jgi:hypothetical protein
MMMWKGCTCDLPGHAEVAVHPCGKQGMHQGHRFHNSQKEVRAGHVKTLGEGPHVLELYFCVQRDQEQSKSCQRVHERYSSAVGKGVHCDETNLCHGAPEMKFSIKEKVVVVILCVYFGGEALDGWLHKVGAKGHKPRHQSHRYQRESCISSSGCIPAIISLIGILQLWGLQGSNESRLL